MNVTAHLSNRTTLVVMLLCMISAFAVHAEPGPLNFTYSYNASAYSDTATLVEFNVQFSNQGVTYVKQKDGSIGGRLYTRLTFHDSLGGEPTMVDWITNVPEVADADQAMISSQLISLAPGKYMADIYYEDLNDNHRQDSAQFALAVPAFSGTRLQLSDVVVVNEASQSEDRSNPFYRNGYLVVPNVGGVIVPPFLVLNTYIEVYNANQVPTSEYHISYKLADARKNIFYETTVTRSRGSRKSVVELNTLPLDSLPSGEYYIIVKAYNGFLRSATDSVMVFRNFTLKNPDMDTLIAMQMSARANAATNTGSSSMAIDPIYAGMREEELNEEYAKVKYVASDGEENIWEGLSGADAKARFLTTFWAARDPSPGTIQNEDRDDYFKRAEEARNLYTAPMTPRGWDSDRGRILLQYGKPDGIERHFQDFNKRPYEVWTYTRLSYDFVFIDRTQTGTFTLVHSTAPSEVHNENWETVTLLNKKWTNE